MDAFEKGLVSTSVGLAFAYAFIALGLRHLGKIVLLALGLAFIQSGDHAACKPVASRPASQPTSFARSR